MGSYEDRIWCDVLPINIAHIILGTPWLYDMDVIHHAQENTYVLKFNGKTIKLYSTKPVAQPSTTTSMTIPSVTPTIVPHSSTTTTTLNRPVVNDAYATCMTTHSVAPTIVSPSTTTTTTPLTMPVVNDAHITNMTTPITSMTTTLASLMIVPHSSTITTLNMPVEKDAHIQHHRDVKLQLSTISLKCNRSINIPIFDLRDTISFTPTIDFVGLRLLKMSFFDLFRAHILHVKLLQHEIHESHMRSSVTKLLSDFFETNLKDRFDELPNLRYIQHAMDLIPCSNTNSASHIAKLFFREVVKLHGIPTSIVSNHDVKFVYYFWKIVWKLLSISLKFSLAFHLQMDGQIEIINTTKFSYNRIVARTTRESPFEIVYGFNSKKPPDLVSRPHQLFSNAAYILALDFHNLHHKVGLQIEYAIELYAFKINATRSERTFNEGNFILASIQHEGHATKKINELRVRDIKPFNVIKRLGLIAYLLNLPSNMLINHVFNVENLIPYNANHMIENAGDAFMTGASEEPLRDVGKFTYFEIDFIIADEVDIGVHGGHIFLISWKDIPHSDDTWHISEELHRFDANFMEDYMNFNSTEQSSCGGRELMQDTSYLLSQTQFQYDPG